MKKKLSYFLSYSGSVRDHSDVGCLPRLEKEIEYLSRSFDIAVYCKDDREFLAAYAGKSPFSGARYFGIRWGGGRVLRRSGNKLIKVLVSGIRLVEYWFVLPVYYRAQIQGSDCCLVKHVSSGVGLALFKKCALLRPKLIIRYNWSWSGFAGRQCAGIYASIVRLLERFALNCSDEILAGDGILKEEARAVVGRKKKIEVIPNWIDTQAFRALATDKAYDVITIGRLSYQKNHRLLLESVDALQKDTGRKVSVLIVGQGGLRQDLQGFARARGVELEIRGLVPNDAIPGLLSKSRVFVLTSRYEGNPKVLLEAMACSMPIVAVDIEGVGNVIAHGVSGLLCAPDKKSLSHALASLLEDEGRRETLARNARALAESVFSFDKVMDALARKIN